VQCACDIDDFYFRVLKSNVIIDLQEYASFGKVYFNFLRSVLSAQQLC